MFASPRGQYLCRYRDRRLFQDLAIKAFIFQAAIPISMDLPTRPYGFNKSGTTFALFWRAIIQDPTPQGAEDWRCLCGHPLRLRCFTLPAFIQSS
jgi:hypothetical protein